MSGRRRRRRRSQSKQLEDADQKNVVRYSSIYIQSGSRLYLVIEPQTLTTVKVPHLRVQGIGKNPDGL